MSESQTNTDAAAASASSSSSSETKQQKEQQEETTQQQKTPQKKVFPAYATDGGHHIEYLLEKHSNSATLPPKQFAAGILPYVTDPKTKDVFFLLCLSKNYKWMNLHGGINGGESLEQGTAREAMEESKNTIDAGDIWRAIMIPDCFATKIGKKNSNYGTIFLVNFGEKNLAERVEYCKQFSRAEGWSKSSREVRAIEFFDAKFLRDVTVAARMNQQALVESGEFGDIGSEVARALSGEVDEDDGFFEDDSQQQQDNDRHHHQHSRGSSNARSSPRTTSQEKSPKKKRTIFIPVEVTKDPESGRSLYLRSCLANTLLHPSFWENNYLVELLDKKNTEILLPVDKLPFVGTLTKQFLPIFSEKTKEKMSEMSRGGGRFFSAGSPSFSQGRRGEPGKMRF